MPASALRVVATLGTTVVELNLSFCEVDRDLRPLEAMYALKTLILDNSSIGDRHIFPYLYHLETLRLAHKKYDRLSPSIMIYEMHFVSIFH